MWNSLDSDVSTWSPSVRKDNVTKPAGVFKHMNGGSWWQDSRSGWLPSVIPPETCIGSLAHPYRTPDNEQRRRPLTIRIQPLIRQLRPAAVWPHYYYSMLLTYCTCACSDIIIIAILVWLLSLLLSFLSSPHLLSPILAIRVYKNACQFCNIIFSHWWGPRIGLKHLNQVVSTLSCDSFWLVEFPIILIPVHVWWISRAINILHNMKGGGLVLYYP